MSSAVKTWILTSNFQSCGRIIPTTRDTDISSDSKKITPSDLMRARRPELYSDSVVDSCPAISQNQLEYHLHTITQRKQELAFDTFCRRLASKEICPNLRPVAGPVGGGDGKVDSETYPVSEAVALTWYYSINSGADKERWAFAFSAKAGWREKARGDIEKVIETDRGYKRFYFITNQAAKGNERADLEKELKKKWKIEVFILDLHWILDRVISKDHWDLVSEILDFDPGGLIPKKKVGPLDSARQNELEEIEKRIADPGNYNSVPYQFVEDCLLAAILSRGLEHPQTEIEGRFLRAAKTAERQGTPHQLFRVLIEQGITANYWFNDHEDLNLVYEKAEKLAFESGSVWDLEKLGILLNAALFWDAEDPRYDKKVWLARFRQYKSALKEIAKNRSKFTSSLWAKTLLLLMDLSYSDRSEKVVSKTARELKDVLEKASNLPEYPMHQIAKLIKDLSEFHIENTFFERLFEKVIAIQGKRTGQSEEGKLRNVMGYQKLKAGKIYDAINDFSAAQLSLLQDENKEDFIGTCFGAALAYETAGLLWASRANLFLGLNKVLLHFVKEGELSPEMLSHVCKLAWLELQLGRVPNVFACLELLFNFASSSDIKSDTAKELAEELSLMDHTLSLLILRSRFEDLRYLEHIPELLKKLHFVQSRAALLFLLGHEELCLTEGEDPQANLDEVFNAWLSNPAGRDLPPQAEWFVQRTNVIRTVLLGCEITVHLEDDLESVLLGEFLLAFLEIIFSSSVKIKQNFAFCPRLSIRIEKSKSAKAPFELKSIEDDCGECEIQVVLPVRDEVSFFKDHEKLAEKLLHLLATVMVEMQLPLTESRVKEILESGKAVQRGLFHQHSSIALLNLFPCYRFKTSDWLFEEITERFPLKRSEAWNRKAINGSAKISINKNNGECIEVENTSGVDFLRHKDIGIITPLNIKLWQEAEWLSLGFGTDGEIPVLAMIFENEEIGQKIFRGWRKLIGESDDLNWINMTIITDIDLDAPMKYRLTIGPNADAVKQTDGVVFNWREMVPVTDKNLKGFIESFNEHKRFKIMPAGNTSRLPGEPLPDHDDLVIEKKHIKITPAWKVGLHDHECGSLMGLDKPIIPPGIKNPPIKEALKHLKSRKFK